MVRLGETLRIGLVMALAGAEKPRSVSAQIAELAVSKRHIMFNLLFAPLRNTVVECGAERAVRET